ncbi:PREDICTED: uncharacterized protein LOC105969398 [Erythranthe guttata]|uniref:uncharacterized protein LOC105969398 n=1 Tax=Erythranthe guttata TaxID=4155 RepID=UPI00064DD566|nr:PREDICTED: uncharacterized protein LOC105969398 [Erythranthe guttata]|eukprot:XP_012849605.1 PREDICTED: uncharacterized protein LOC105969398 [Erythranthe guttata]
MEIKEYSKQIIRLFGVDISVHPNTPQEDPVTPPESSSSPTPAAVSSPISTVLSLYNNQEKHVPDQSLVPAAAAAGSRPSSDKVPAKSPAKKTAAPAAPEEFREFDIIDYYPMMACGDFRPVIFFTAPEEVGCSSRGATSDPKADNKSSSDLLIIRSPSPDDVVSRKPQSKKRVSGTATYTHDVSPLLKKKAKVISNEIVLYSPKPLQSFPPSMNRHHDVSPNHNGRWEEKKKVKGKLIITDEENVSEPAPVRKIKRTIRRRDKTLFIRGESSSSSIPDTVLPLEEIPGMIETIESHNGSKPVFLYHKKLETSDVWDHLNRLNINTPEILMSLLRDEERIAVTETRIGVQCIGIDKGGRSFNLHLGKWPSLQMIVINKQWGRIVNANNAVKGDWVEIWGYRVNGSDELRLAINFRKQEEIDQRMIAAAAASTSSSSSSTN